MYLRVLMDWHMCLYVCMSVDDCMCLSLCMLLAWRMCSCMCVLINGCMCLMAMDEYMCLSLRKAICEYYVCVNINGWM